MIHPADSDAAARTNRVLQWATGRFARELVGQIVHVGPPGNRIPARFLGIAGDRLVRVSYAGTVGVSRVEAHLVAFFPPDAPELSPAELDAALAAGLVRARGRTKDGRVTEYELTRAGQLLLQAHR